MKTGNDLVAEQVRYSTCFCYLPNCANQRNFAALQRIAVLLPDSSIGRIDSFLSFHRPGPCRPEGTFLPECPHGFGRNTWLVGNRVKTKAPYVVKLLPIAVELIEKYRGVNEFKVSPDRVFPVGEIGSMEDSLKRIGEKTGCSVRVSPHTAKHNSFVI